MKIQSLLSVFVAYTCICFLLFESELRQFHVSTVTAADNSQLPTVTSGLLEAGCRGILAGSYYSAKPPSLFLIIHACPHTAAWRWGCHCQGRNKGTTITYAIFSWINNVLNVLGNTLKIPNELISFLQSVWSSPESLDNGAGEGWDIRPPVRRNCAERESNQIYLEIGRFGPVLSTNPWWCWRASGIACSLYITPCSLMSWIAFYKHSLCFITAGYAVSLLWRCRVTPD